MSGFGTLAVGHSARRAYVFSPERLESYADLVGDHAPVHMDDEFARRRSFPGRIVHGLFVGSIFSGLLGEQLPGPGCVITTVSLKYHRPVPIGVTVDYEVRIRQLSGAVATAVLDLEARLEDGTVCVSGVSTCSFPQEQIP